MSNLDEYTAVEVDFISRTKQAILVMDSAGVDHWIPLALLKDTSFLDNDLAEHDEILIHVETWKAKAIDLTGF